jgi:hypothetical protein
MNAEAVLGDLLSLAGIAINGPNPWDVRVRNEAAYSRALANGSLLSSFCRRAAFAAAIRASDEGFVLFFRQSVEPRLRQSLHMPAI